MKYLRTYAEPESGVVDALGGERWDEAVVLPVLGEAEIDSTIRSIDFAAAALSSNHRVLCLLIVNARKTSPPDMRAMNERLLNDLKALPARPLADTPPIFLAQFSKTTSLLVVDRSSLPFAFPEDQGVGLARKIGADIATAIWARGNLTSDLIHTTDGDAIVAEDYFVRPARAIAVGHHRYTHLVDDKLPALGLYEISLRYYSLALRWAGSPYAFPTIGSTMAFSPRAYAEARGFPRRDAAEDFYLMNKLAKLGEVAELPGRVFLKARFSGRVPFGTGAATARITHELAEGISFRMYDPRVFLALKETIALLDGFSRDRDIGPIEKSELAPLLRSLGAFEALAVARDTRPRESDLQRHLHTWFDAFRTLKFVHGARDTLFPSVTWQSALETAPFLPSLPSNPFDALRAVRSLEESYNKRQ